MNRPLQALRGILAVVVGVGHSLIVTPPDSAARIGLFFFTQNSAVIVFFVISGYVLQPSAQRLPFADFVAKRSLRLWPIALVSMLVGAAYIGLVPVRSIPDGTSWFNGLYAARLADVSLMRNALLIDWDLNAVLWSIYVEAAAAVTLPFLIRKPSLLVFAALVAASFVRADQKIEFLYCFLYCFYAGAYVREYGWRVTTPLFALALIALPLTEYANYRGFFDVGMKNVLNTASAFAIVSFVVYRIKSAPRALVYLGDISYSFYAVHLLAMHAIAVAVTSNVWVVAAFSCIVSAALAIPLHRICAGKSSDYVSVGQ